MKVFVGICNSQEVIPAGFFWTYTGMRKPCPIIVYRATNPWDVIRNNEIIDTFLKSDCDILAKMDIDQTYPSDYLERLIPLCLEYKVVGPLIYDRCKQNKYMPLAFNEVDWNKFPIKKMDIDGLSGIVEVQYPHTNLLYHREVLEKIPAPWYEAYLSQNGLKRANHVDYTFIDKIHRAGYKIMIDLDCNVGHMETRFIMRANADNQ